VGLGADRWARGVINRKSNKRKVGKSKEILERNLLAPKNEIKILLALHKKIPNKFL
jgi:hypothetical protein